MVATTSPPNPAAEGSPAPRASTVICVTPAGTTNACEAPVKLKTCELPDAASSADGAAIELTTGSIAAVRPSRFTMPRRDSVNAPAGTGASRRPASLN
jgi:hypothetical protein